MIAFNTLVLASGVTLVLAGIFALEDACYWWEQRHEKNKKAPRTP